MSLSVDDVRNVHFDRPPLGRRGYSERDVDRFLDTVIEALAHRRSLTAEDVRSVEFGRPLLPGGYDEQQVDAFLDLLATQFGPAAVDQHEVLDAELVESEPFLDGPTVSPRDGFDPGPPHGGR